MLSDKDSPHFLHRIYLIRHGETEWSKSSQHTGLTDIPLTEEGEKQAKRLPKALEKVNFVKVYCSPLLRAQKTCELAGFLNQAELTSDLLEWDYGKYEGITTKDIRKSVPNWDLFKDGVPSGETIEQVSKRADQILEKCLEENGDVALFSSGHISRIIGARWLQLDPRFAKHLKLSTATLSILGYEHEWRVIDSWNVSPSS